MNLREKLKSCKTQKELDILIKEMSGYKNISPVSRARNLRIAERKQEELNKIAK